MTIPKRNHARPLTARAASAHRPGALRALLTAVPALPEQPGEISPNINVFIEHALIDSSQPSMPGDVIDAVLNAYLDNGRLVPARFADSGTGVLDDRRLQRARMLDKLRANAFADTTLHSYGYAVRGWRDWCREEGVPALPFEPSRVANHLIDYALKWDDEREEFQRDEEGELLNAVVMGTVELRLAALNKAAEFIGLPKPGDNEGVRELMRGLRRTFLSAKVNQKQALTHDLLLRCLAAIGGRGFIASRSRAALLLRARTGATAGQIERLAWIDVTFDEDCVTLELAPTHRHGARRTVSIRAHRSNPRLCLVRALRDLRAVCAGPYRVFTHASGAPMTRQAIHLAGQKAATEIGGWEALPSVADRHLARVLDDGEQVADLQRTRDRALLLTGFWGALRRSNLSALKWADLVDHDRDGIEVILRKSKTDQEGVGDSVWAPVADPDSDTPCPASALRRWRRELTAALGRPPLPTEPVFPGMTGAGTLKVNRNGRLVRLSGQAINEVVQRVVIKAGIAADDRRERNPFGAHSLRAGFVTEAAMAGMGLTEIMGVTKHKTAQIVMAYIRMVRDAQHNGSRRLLGMVGRSRP